MRKAFKRFFMTLIILILLLGGAVWWLLSYISPDEPLDMAYTPISVSDKALAIIKNLNTELILTESDVNYLIKSHLSREYSAQGTAAGSAALELTKDVRMDGAVFELEEDKLVARMNVTYKDLIPARLDAVYSLEWQPPNIALRPQSLAVKDIALPLSLLESIVIPLELPEQEVVTIRDVTFEQNQIRVLFKVDVKLPF